jgi:hypothetical protein
MSILLQGGPMAGQELSLPCCPRRLGFPHYLDDGYSARTATYEYRKNGIYDFSGWTEGPHTERRARATRKPTPAWASARRSAEAQRLARVNKWLAGREKTDAPPQTPEREDVKVS